MKNGIILSAIVFTLSLTACSNYLEEFEDEYRDSAYAKTDIFSPTESSASIIDAGDSSGTSSKDASSSDARAEGQSSGKTDEEYDCYMNDSACISEIANEFGKTVRLLDSRNNNVYTAIYVGGLDFETANGYSSIFDDSVSFLLMTENLEYEGESVTALDTNGVFFYTYENAEKACPTGWRLPKITPEWFFLLTGEGHQFNIELPDDEKGCYTNGKFDSGKSIFYWAQKEGKTSWFVQKNYLANDYDLHEQERCNTFPVRCVKEFGRYADYAGSSSSSSGPTSGNSGLKNCNDYKTGKILYDGTDNSLFSKHSNAKTDSVYYKIEKENSVVKLEESSMFCIEFTYKSEESSYFYYGFTENGSVKYLKKFLYADSAYAFNAYDFDCNQENNGKTTYECELQDKKFTLENVNYFRGNKGLKIKKVYVLNADTISVQSSESSSSSSSAKSSSSSVASSSSEVCSEYDSGRTYATVARITFVNETGNSEMSRDLNEDFFEPSENIIKTVKQRVVNSFSACKLSNGNIQVKSFDDENFNDNDTFKSICYDSNTVKVFVSEEDFSCINNYSKCFRENKLSFNSECPVAAAAKFLGSSSSSVTGSMLFDAKELYMKNGSAINVVGFDSSFADGWMNVAGYISNSRYIYFFTDPGLENEVGALPVDISAWGGICMTYASNVNIKVVAHDSRNEGGNEGYVMMSSKFDATNGNQAEFVCVDWEDKATSLTNIDQIQLKPVSSSSSDPAVIYIKNIYTKKPTDVTISTSDKNCGGENRKYCKELGDEQIDLSLFESYTVTGETCNEFDLLVTANSESYYICGKDSPQTVEIDNAQVGTSDCGDLNLKYANLINPVLEGFSFVCLGQPSVTFHPKSWYAAPVPSSTSN